MRSYAAQISRSTFRNVVSSSPRTGAFIASRCLPNDLPFSSERQGRVRAYHGREEPRAQPAASRHETTSERTRVAFGCCNGRLDRVHLALKALEGVYGSQLPSGHENNTDDSRCRLGQDGASGRHTRGRYRWPMRRAQRSTVDLPRAVAGAAGSACTGGKAFDPSEADQLGPSNDLVFSGERPPERSEEGRSTAATPC